MDGVENCSFRLLSQRAFEMFFSLSLSLSFRRGTRFAEPYQFIHVGVRLAKTFLPQLIRISGMIMETEGAIFTEREQICENCLLTVPRRCLFRFNLTKYLLNLRIIITRKPVSIIERYFVVQLAAISTPPHPDIINNSRF